MGIRISALVADTLILGLTFHEAYQLLRFSVARRASTVLKLMSQQGKRGAILSVTQLTDDVWDRCYIFPVRACH